MDPDLWDTLYCTEEMKFRTKFRRVKEKKKRNFMAGCGRIIM